MLEFAMNAGLLDDDDDYALYQDNIDSLAENS